MRSSSVAALAAIMSVARAEIQMPSVFGDHMVLQTNSEYGARSFVWGVAEPAEIVTVHEGSRSYSVPASATGAWKVQLNPSSSYKPFTLTVSGSVSTNTLSFADVVFGDVILCSGQSNMVFSVENMFGAASILAHNASDASGVRVLSVTRSAEADPQFQLPTGQDCSWGKPTPSALPCSQWTPASPDAVAPFSALCYTTALYWAQTSGRPVGLVNSAWGGTPVEAWMPPDAFAMCPQFPPAGADANRAAAQTPALRQAQASGAVPVWDQSPEDSAVNQYNDSALFNGMIAPIVGYSVRAVIWDQGERNSVEGFSEARYSCYFGAMINSWRDLWGIGDFAFIFAQLAPYDTADNVTAIRMAQYDTMARPGGFMDTTGMISQIDLGDLGSPYGSVHSRNKTEAGRRSALQMQHVMQGIQDISFSWAVPVAVAQQASPDAASGSVTVSFDADTLYNGTLRLLNAPNCSACCYGNTTFQLGASPSGPWTNASAAIGPDGTTVVVTPVSATSPGTPSFVRYAASNFPDCIITNNANIGTVPFVMPVGAALDTRSTRFDAHRPLLYPGADKDTLPADMGGLRRAFKGVGNVTRPPLYWNSWNAARCNMDARIAMIQGDLAVKNNLPFANDGYVVHDDCWQVERHPDGTMRADPVRYPNGVSEVSSYLNGKGIGFGLYTARGSRTCQNRPGSYQHENQDAHFYFQNNISYIKIDDCGGTNWPQANDSWTRFRDGFEQYYGDKTIPVISVEYCSDPTQCGLWIGDTANMARSTGDIQATIGSILSNADLNSVMAPAQTCTYYADPDMLELDAPGVTFNQSAVQLGLWSIMGSPLGLSTDIRFLSPAYLALMTNAELIAIDQDAVCKQGSKVIDNGSSSTQAWARPLSNGDVAVALLNRGTSVASLTADFKSLGITAASASVRDVLNNKDLPDASGSVSSGLGPTSLVLYRLTPKA